jgi:hypothetical protein
VVEQGGEPEDVAPRVALGAGLPLRAHVRALGVGQRVGGVDGARAQPDQGDGGGRAGLRAAVVGDEHRGGREAAVHEADGVRLGERLDEPAGEPHDAPRREAPGLGDQGVERTPGRAFGRHEQPTARRVAVGLELGGRGVPDPARRVGLAHHPVHEGPVLHGPGAEHVDSAGGARRQVRRVVDVRHGAAGELGGELVLAQQRRLSGGARRGRQRGSGVHGVSCGGGRRRGAKSFRPTAGRPHDDPAPGRVTIRAAPAGRRASAVGRRG